MVPCQYKQHQRQKILYNSDFCDTVFQIVVIIVKKQII